MQIATIEFARNVAKLNGANSTEFDQASPHPVICLLEEQKSITHKGASMRLGTWVCDLKPKTKVRLTPIHITLSKQLVWLPV